MDGATASLHDTVFLSLFSMWTCVGTLLRPMRQRASPKSPDWRLTRSSHSTSCLAELVPRGLKMESCRATPCHLDRVDLGARSSARIAEGIKCCTTTFKYSFQLLRIMFLKRVISTRFSQQRERQSGRIGFLALTGDQEMEKPANCGNQSALLFIFSY